jgi:hypothetical protein
MNNQSLLQHLQTRAIQAHNNTSFSPERRGEQMIKEYSEELASDLQELQTGGAGIEALNDYKQRYERYFSQYLGAKGNTFSVMITGSGNFPVRRHEKANRSERRHYEIFREWRVRAKKAILRKAQPEKTYSSELERYRAELEGMKRNHELMKEGNRRIKDANRTGEDLTEYLTTVFNIEPHMLEYTMRRGFYLQNSLANIKRVEDRIKELEQKETMQAKQPVTKYLFDGGHFLVNYEVDRIQVFFDTRPSAEELTKWKARGLNSYNWSPSAKAWQRKITANALWHVKRLFDNIKKA